MKRKIVGLFLIVCILCTFMPCAGAASVVAEGECGADGSNVTWTLDSDGTLTFKGTGRIINYDWFNKVPWLYEDGNVGRERYITKVIVDDGITNVCDYMCYGCSDVTEIILASSVSEIGENAFWKCGISSIKLPENLKKIGDVAFIDCSALLNITIGDNVTEIGQGAFSNCTSLSSITIPDSITSIGNGAFGNCPIETIKLPGSIKTFNEDLGLNSCKNIIFSEGTVSVERQFWTNALNIELEKVTFPSTVRTIDYIPSYNNLREIEVDRGNPIYRSIDGVLFDISGKELINYPAGKKDKNYVVRDGVEKIADYAFCDCKELRNIYLPDTVTEIGQVAFSSCSNLKSVVIPDGVQTIKEYTFSYCSSLNTVTIPNSVTTVERVAFEWCTSLTDVYYQGTQDEWNEIDISDGTDEGEGDNSVLKNANIHFLGHSEGETEIADTPSIEHSDNKYAINVPLNNVQFPCCLITALYSEGALKKTEITDVEPGDASVNVTLEYVNADTAKIFLWGNLTMINPLCEAKTININ